MLGRFIDASYAFRFGPPAFDVVVATLEDDRGLRSQSFRFPAGRPTALEDADALWLHAEARREGADILLAMASRRLVHGARLTVPGYDADDNAFSIEPGTTRTVALRANGDDPSSPAFLAAVNLAAPLALDLPRHP